MDTETLKRVKQALPAYQSRQIDATLKLLDDHNTVPFIARYRKEMTGDLNEVEIRDIQDEANRISKLQQRKQEVLNQISEQHQLTAKLTVAIKATTQLQQVEDLYLPYKQKRRTKRLSQKTPAFIRWHSGYCNLNVRPLRRLRVNISMMRFLIWIVFWRGFMKFWPKRLVTALNFGTGFAGILNETGF